MDAVSTAYEDARPERWLKASKAACSSVEGRYTGASLLFFIRKRGPPVHFPTSSPAVWCRKTGVTCTLLKMKGCLADKRAHFRLSEESLSLCMRTKEGKTNEGDCAPETVRPRTLRSLKTFSRKRALLHYWCITSVHYWSVPPRMKYANKHPKGAPDGCVVDERSEKRSSLGLELTAAVNEARFEGCFSKH